MIIVDFSFSSVLPAHVIAIQTVMHSNLQAAGIYMRSRGQRAWKMCSFVVRYRVKYAVLLRSIYARKVSSAAFGIEIGEIAREYHYVRGVVFSGCKLVTTSIRLILNLLQNLRQKLQLQYFSLRFEGNEKLNCVHVAYIFTVRSSLDILT